MKNLLAIAVIGIVATSSFAGAIVDDMSGIGNFFDGATSLSTGIGTWSTGTGAASFRHNMEDDLIYTSDHWLGFNGGSVWKDFAGVGDADGVASPSAAGWVGVYRGAGGDTVTIDYTTTASDAVTMQGVQYKHYIERKADTDVPSIFTVTFENVTDGGSLSFNSPSFGPASSSADVAEDLASTTAYGAGDGSTVDVYYDLTSLGIDAGDQVKITYGLLGNQSNGRRTAVGVQFIPEPATMSLLAIGGIAAVIRRRRR